MLSIVLWGAALIAAAPVFMRVWAFAGPRVLLATSNHLLQTAAMAAVFLIVWSVTGGVIHFIVSILF